MKISAGFEQCYNGQTAVDAHAQIIESPRHRSMASALFVYRADS
jgi:hypothetical protein